VHTFDIRFAKSVGLAGLFEAPANRLGWKGSGLLSIDGQGISIAVKRGLLTLFTRPSRRFPSDSLTEAYREGDALRLVFGNRERQEILSVWARGGETAAEIVKLLPTLRTVELDHSTGSARRYRFDWRTALLLLALAVVVAAALSLLLRPRGIGGLPESAASSEGLAPAADSAPIGADGASGTVASTRDASSPTMSPTDAPVRAGRATASGTGALAAGDLGSPAAVEMAAPAGADLIDSANDGASAPAVATATGRRDHFIDMVYLRQDYFDLRGATSADVLAALEARWWQISVDIYVSTPGADYRPRVSHVLAISRAWRNHLHFYAESLRTGDQSLMQLAQGQLELAEDLQRRLQTGELP